MRYLLVRCRLPDSFSEQLGPHEIIGAPTDVQATEALKEISPHQFEWWAVVARPSWPWARFTGETPVLRARPAKDHKKGADNVFDVCEGPEPRRGSK